MTDHLDLIADLQMSTLALVEQRLEEHSEERKKLEEDEKQEVIRGSNT